MKIIIIKRMISLLLSIILTILSCTSLFADDQITNTVYGLDEIIKMSLDANARIKLYDNKIKLAERRYKSAEDVSKNAMNKGWDTAAQRIEYKKQELLYPLQKLDVLDDLKWEKENYIATLENDIKKLFIKVQSKDLQIVAQKITLSNLNKDYEIKKLQAEQGSITQSGLLSLEISIQEAQDTYESLQWEKDKLINDIKIKAGYNADEDLSIIYEDIVKDEFVAEDLDKLIEEKLQTFRSIKESEENLELTKKEYFIVTTYAIVEIPKEADTLKEKIEDLEYNIENEKISLEIRMRTDYNNILNLNDDIAIRKLSLDKAIKQEDIAKVKYELGLISSLDYEKVQSEASNAKSAYERAVLDYNTAVIDFRFFLERQ